MKGYGPVGSGELRAGAERRVDIRPWLTGPARPELRAREAHVWHVDVDGIGPLSGIVSDLSLQERERAARFHRRVDARRSLASRWILREILGRYLGIEAREVAFRYGEHGKPALAGDERNPPDLQFNLTHAASVALVAVSHAFPLGVDVERVRPFSHLEGVAGRFFSASEQRMLLALPPDLRTEAFYQIWTRKEAFVKALGEGLTHPLGSFDVSLDVNRPRLLRVKGTSSGTERWSVAHLAPAEGYVGALFARTRPLALRRWRWTAHPV